MRALAVMVLVVGCSKAVVPAEATADARFEALAGRYIDELVEHNPESATRLGEHKNDARLNDRSRAARMEQLSRARATLAELETIPVARLSAEDSIDARILHNQLEGTIYQLDTLRDWEWNPLGYNVGGALDGLISRDFAPAAVRLQSAIGRLSMVPAVVAAAKENLKTPPKVYTETALQQNPGLISLVQKQFEPLVKEAPQLEKPFREAQQKAVAALQEYQQWLKDDLLPRSTGDFRLGDEKFRKKLRFALDSDIPAEQLLARAEADLNATQEAMFETALQVHPNSSTDKHVVIQAALDSLAVRHPDNSTVIALAEKDLAETTAFVKAKDFITVPDEPVNVTPTPEFARGFAVASCNSPGALEKNGKTFYYISPTPTDWPQKRVDSFFREYDDDMLQEVTIHEAMPGHYLQLAHANKFHGPTMIRAIASSGTFIEGWATYSEQVMADAGYGGPAVRIQQQKMRLRFIINAIIDQKIHTAGMTEKEAVELMMKEGFQEEGEATGKWKRAQLSSTQLSTYYVGNLEMNELRAAWEKKYGKNELKKFHDSLLAYGSPPSKYVKERLGL
ncbi:MAG TPA: DUF885 domain-containing protein [Myxococcales bacterium]|nr:DUF885 domain-containing protein [Myxococcales bacterium]